MSAKGQRHNILIVEDDSAHAELIRRAFETQGDEYLLKFEKNLKSAKAYIDEFTPHLVITDLLLPDGRGIDLLPDEMEKQKFPVVVMTSHGNEQVAVEAMRIGALDYIVKSNTTLADMPHTAQRALREWQYRKEQKEAKAALLESERRYRLLFEQSNDAILIHDLDGHIMDFNQRASELLGYEKEQFKKLSISELHPKEEITQSKNAFRETLENGYTLFESKFIKADGSVCDVEVSSRITDRDKGIVQGIIRDISERKLSEKALRESEERYRIVLDANPDPVVVYDTKGNVTYFNTAFKEVFGWTLQERFGEKLDDFVPEKNWSETKMMIDKVLGGERISGIESRRYTKSGNIIPVSISGSIYRDQEGEPLGSVVNIRDISDRKKLEARLVQVQKMEAIGTLAGGIAHDFNNILFPMVGYAELALDDLPDDSPVGRCLQEILTGTSRAGDLVKQILKFSRHADQEVKPLKIDLIVREVLRLMRSSLPSTIEIKEYTEKECGLVMADATEIHQIAMNLMTNAFHAMEEMGGTLEVTLKETELKIDDFKDPSMIPGPYVCLAVADSGIGMDKSVMNRIFDPYYTTKEKIKARVLVSRLYKALLKDMEGI